jgi:hypothetical protein
MFNLVDEGVHFQRRDCSASEARGVQLGRYIHVLKFTVSSYRTDN